MIAEIVLGLVSAERTAELLLSARNTARLRRAGAQEIGAPHFYAFVVLQAAWLCLLWLHADGRPVMPAFLALYALVQAGRAWVFWTLGDRWTVRVLVVPGERLVQKGPYRYVSHPNYVVLALEIPLLPLAFSMPLTALGLGAINLALLAWRIRDEDRALAPLRQGSTLLARDEA